VRHAIFLERLSSQYVEEIVAFLNSEVFPDLLDRAFSGLSRLPLSASTPTTQRYDKLISSLSGLIRSGYRNLNGQLESRLKALALSEAKWATAVLREVTPIQIDFLTPSPATLRALIESKPMQGRFLADWTEDAGTAMAKKVEAEIGTGVVQGEGVDQIVRRLRGTSADNFSDGVLEMGRRDAEAVTRTAVNHIANAASEQVYAENQDVIKAVRFVATLDSRTTEICASLDGKTFPIGEGPRPPLHWRCRSKMSPVLRSWKELGIDLKEAPPGTRESMDGYVPDTMTYPEWLRHQPPHVQDEILGKGKAALFRRGKVKFNRFVNSRYEPLTLKQLEALERRLS